ncbi:MAG TPA: BamA/TamA family outer membrane protein [Vicinamibacterales bacterium]|jgi:hypothetical protein
MTARRTHSVLLAVVFALLACGGTRTEGASRYQPGLRFRTIVTPHFCIYYHQGGQALARQVAAIAESVHATLPARVRLQAPRVTHVVLSDQDDESSGSATPVPYNTITLDAAWPGSSDLLGNTSDWLRLVFTHEYMHILQFDQSVGWASVLRRIVGRAPIVFPNLFLPQWQFEGLATFEESRTTGQGRLYSGDVAAVVRSRMRDTGPEPIDRVSGGAVEWPGGLGPYLVGAYFYQYLADRFGEAKLGELSRRTAGRLPYLASRAFRQTFGESLGALWRDFGTGQHAGTPVSTPPSTPPSAIPRRLTSHGYFVTAPRFAAGGRALLYSTRDADRFPAIMTLAMDRPGTPRRIATRAGGTHIGVSGDLVFFDQFELEDGVALRSDLYVTSLRTGGTRRLTHGARLVEPDVSPDGRALACVRMAGGRRHLALFRVVRATDGRVSLDQTAATPPGWSIAMSDVANFGSPRWSPDGEWIAAERRVDGGPSEIVVIRPDDGAMAVLASTRSGRSMTPTWLPDGQAVLFAADDIDRAFQIFAVATAGHPSVRQVTSVPGGATYPDVSPDGRHLVFVSALGEGYDAFEMPLDPSTWTTSSGGRGWPVGPTTTATLREEPTTERPYSPVPTLLPRAWLPGADAANGLFRLGVRTDGVDVLGRHLITASVLWRLSGGGDAITGPHTARPDWNASYVYGRWQPSMFVAASDQTSYLAHVAKDGIRLPDAELRELNVKAGVAWPIARMRHTQIWQSALNVERDTLNITGQPRSYHRHAMQSAWTFSSAKAYGRAVSLEDGVALSATSEQVRGAFGADGNADAFTAEFRGYARLGRGHSVLAARAGIGGSSGDVAVRRLFYLGGASPAGPLVNFGSGALSMLRGFDDKVFSGSRIAVGNVEWRQPLWRVDRGWGTFPLLLRSVHGAAFADVGHAWDDRFSLDDAKVAVGAEFACDVVAGFSVPLTLAGGVAWTRDGTTGRRGSSAYFRLGRSF